MVIDRRREVERKKIKRGKDKAKAWGVWHGFLQQQRKPSLPDLQVGTRKKHQMLRE